MRAHSRRMDQKSLQQEFEDQFNDVVSRLQSKQLFQSDWDIASFAVFFIFIGMILLLVILVVIRCCCCCCCDDHKKRGYDRWADDELQALLSIFARGATDSKTHGLDPRLLSDGTKTKRDKYNVAFHQSVYSVWRCVAALLPPPQSQGMKILPYLHDWFICAPSWLQVAQITACLLYHMGRLGLKVY
ncbi:hypothetical protein F2P81_014447 [Scophthalmus maximus]|uniref:Small integral membrane protein 22 n=1 Tax=Scophthalmus maximus TaxID=52904 RepID=A0A6A4SFX2_SCOMX|nr:hypothetical protein F2P81_014447 [Scophthalmus maximus]